MGALYRYIFDIITGAWSLVAGMSVTLRYMLKPVVTVQYPRKRLVMPEAYRGHIEFKTFSDNSSHHCVACGECSRVCPSKVIKVMGLKEKASSVNRAQVYIIDFSRCSLCGLCAEVCPQQTLRFSKEYELAGVSRYEGVVDLVERQRKQVH